MYSIERKAAKCFPVLNQSLAVSRYLSNLGRGSLVERLDKLNGLGPLPLRWF